MISNSLDYFAVYGPKDAGTELGIPGFNSDTQFGNPGIPSIYVDVLGDTGPTLGNTSANWYQDDRTIDGYDELSYTFGRHNIMAGAELRKLTIGREAANDARGVFNFNGRLAAQVRAIPVPVMAPPILSWAWLSRPPLLFSRPRVRLANGEMASLCWTTGR